MFEASTRRKSQRKKSTMKNRIVKMTIAAALLGGIWACGSSEETIADKWSDYCDTSATVTAADCPADMDNSGLTLFCKAAGGSFYDTAECNDQLDALIACNGSREWACWEGGEVPMVVEPDPCSAESEPFGLPSGSCVDPSKVEVTSN